VQLQRFKVIVSFVFLITLTLICRPSLSDGASVVHTDKHLYNPGEPITVRFSNSPGIGSDWMCIVPVGAPDTSAGDYQYLPRGVEKGVVTFAPRQPGNYEVRVYYNYRQNGYVVTGRYPFSVTGAPVAVSEPAPVVVVPPSAEPMTDAGLPPEAPPPIEYTAPPDVVVLPGTDIYVAPGLQVDVFFQQGWWWRPWSGRWYRSRFYDHGWGFYSGAPSWYGKIPHDWRNNYRNHTWGGHAWNPHVVPNRGLDRHWREGKWRHDHGWAGQGKPTVHRDRPSDRTAERPGKPDIRGDRPSSRPGEGPDKHAVRGNPPIDRRPGEGPGKPAVKGEGPQGGKPGEGPGKPTIKGEGPRGGRPGGPDKPVVKDGGTGGGKPGAGKAGEVTPSDERATGRQGDGTGRGGRR
jgi:hypothetical protein